MSNYRQTVKRIISAPMVVFKGSGFYQTDYKSENSIGGSASNDNSSASSDSSSSDSAASCDGTGPQGGCGACSTDD